MEDARRGAAGKIRPMLQYPAFCGRFSGPRLILSRRRGNPPDAGKEVFVNYPLPISAKRVGAAVCSVALVSALSLPPIAFAQGAGASDAAAQSGISLQSRSCMLRFDQALIDQVGLQHASGACLGYAAAYASTITSGEVHSWVEYDMNGGSGSFYGRNMTDEFEHLSLWDEASVLRTLYGAVNEGRPVVLYVTTGSGSQHWVTVVGYENVDDPDNLSTDNFIILDPDATTDTAPESLSARGLHLRYGDGMGNVRISYATAGVDDGRVASEHFSDCYYGDWYVDSGVIDYVYDHNLIMGLSGTTRFDPDGELTRGQAATILWRMAGSPAASVDEPLFNDVTDPDAFYYNAVRWAREYGVVRGVGDTNTFAPCDCVTREQLAIMICNYAEHIAHLSTVSNGSGLSALADASSIDTWAQSSFAWCFDKGIITGQPSADGTYANPQQTATRAQAAKIVTVFHRDVLGLG